MMKKLSQDEVRQIHRAAIESRFDRAALLSGLPRGVDVGIRDAADPAGQMLVDLDHLNDFEPAVGEAPLITWLKNAVLLSPARAQSSIFAAALRTLGVEAPADTGAITTGTVVKPSASLRPPLPLASLGPVSALACELDLVATGHRGGAAALWDSLTGKRISLLVGHGAEVTSLAFSPGGDRLAVATKDGLVRLHERRTGKQQRPLRTPAGGLVALAFHPHGQVLFGVVAGGAVVSWELSSGRKLWTLESRAGVPVSVACIADGLRVARVEGTRTRVLEVRLDGAIPATADINEIASVEHRGLRGAVLDDKGTLLVTVGVDNGVRAWSLPGGELQSERAGATNDAEHIASAGEGRHLAVSTVTGVSGSSMNSSVPWRVLAMDQIGVTAAVLGERGESVWSGASDGVIRRIRLLTGEVDAVRAGHAGSVVALVPSPGGHFVVSVGGDNSVELWDGAAAYRERTLYSLEEAIRSLAMPPDGGAVLCGLSDGQIDVFDIADKHHARVDAHAAPVVALAADGASKRRFASGAADGSVQIWADLARKAGSSWVAHDSAVRSLAFSPSGRLLASGAAKGDLSLWQVDTSSRKHHMAGHRDEVASVAFSPDGNVLASGSMDGTIRLWNARTGASLRTLVGHANGITSVVFDRTGRGLVSGALDGAVHMWDVASGRLVACTLVRSGVEWVTFLPDGTFVGSASLCEGLLREGGRDGAACPVHDASLVTTVLRAMFLGSP